MFEDLVVPALNPRLQTLPEKYWQLRSTQIDVVTRALDAYRSGVRVVVVDAPTGSGKTLISEMIRRMLNGNGVFVCSGIELQRQFARDFAAPMLMGRRNYLPVSGGTVRAPLLGPGTRDVTCEDCTAKSPEDDCLLCPVVEACPYRVAVRHAVAAPIAALNSHYWLSAVTGEKSPWKRRGLVVIDECDTLESVLMNVAEVSMSNHRAVQWGISSPKRMTKADSWLEWGNETIALLRGAAKDTRGNDGLDEIRKGRTLDQIGKLIVQIRGMVNDVEAEVPWVYTGGAGSDRRRGENIQFKPVMVDKVGREKVWGNGGKFLLMSGTVVSDSMMMEELGYDEEYATISIPSPFPARNRPVIVRPVGDMSKKGQENGGLDQVLTQITGLVDETYDRILIHAVSYRLARSIFEHIRRVLPRRPTYSYGSAAERAQAISDYRTTPHAVLVAPSAERGIDLPDDACRRQIIAKVPYPYLGDQQVQARVYQTRSGKLWYQVQVARTIMQMVGRGVRHEKDWCECYVLDASFVRHWEQWKQLYPAWFRMAVRFDYTTGK